LSPHPLTTPSFAVTTEAGLGHGKSWKPMASLAQLPVPLHCGHYHNQLHPLPLSAPGQGEGQQLCCRDTGRQVGDKLMSWDICRDILRQPRVLWELGCRAFWGSSVKSGATHGRRAGRGQPGSGQGEQGFCVCSGGGGGGVSASSPRSPGCSKVQRRTETRRRPRADLGSKQRCAVNTDRWPPKEGDPSLG
jgi:hypothetical protein